MDVNELRVEALERVRIRAQKVERDEADNDLDAADRAVVMQTSSVLLKHLPKAQHAGTGKVAAAGRPAKALTAGLTNDQLIAVLKKNRVRQGEVHGPEDES